MNGVSQAGWWAFSVLLLGGLLVAGPQDPPAEPDKRKDVYEYQQDLTRAVGVLLNGSVAYGRLNGAGNFTADKSLHPPIVNQPLIPDEEVYEYRTGSLIKGTLRKDGAFVPERGSKVLAFAEYLKEYDPEWSPRVYNLPGRIVNKNPPAEERDPDR